jgi:hypothetical protein
VHHQGTESSSGTRTLRRPRILRNVPKSKFLRAAHTSGPFGWDVDAQRNYPNQDKNAATMRNTSAVSTLLMRTMIRPCQQQGAAAIVKPASPEVAPLLINQMSSPRGNFTSPPSTATAETVGDCSEGSHTLSPRNAPPTGMADGISRGGGRAEAEKGGRTEGVIV